MMNTIVGLFFCGIVILFSIPMFVLIVECFSALRPPKQPHDKPSGARIPRIAVLIPAHNEAEGIQATIESVKSQLLERDELVVVADNCTDSTAEVAQALGATVLNRSCTAQRGKGYALAHGLNYLKSDKPDVVVVIDADCQIRAGTLRAISEKADARSRPVQAVYLMKPSDVNNPQSTVSALAVVFRNWIRPLGLCNLGLSCQLTGSGMAFPWEALQLLSLANSNLVEDMQMGLDLALLGYPPLLCPEAFIDSQLPQGRRASQSQRTRWEHGHLKTLLTQAPRLLKGAIIQRRFDLLGLALDLCVPPLSLLALMIGGTLLVSLLLYIGTGMANLLVYVLFFEVVILLVMIGLAWNKFARDSIPLIILLAIPLYIFSKLSIYANFLTKPQQEWVRTERISIGSTDKVSK